MSHPLEASDRPRLAAHVRLVSDPTRERQMLLAPERVLILNPTGAAIVDLCDGKRTVGEIIDVLGKQYNHVDDKEVRRFLDRLVVKRCLEAAHE